MRGERRYVARGEKEVGGEGREGGEIPTAALRPGLMEVLTVPFRLMERLTAVITGSSPRLGTMAIAHTRRRCVQQ